MSKKSFCVFGAENYIQKEIVQYLQDTLEEGEAYLRVVCSINNHGLQKEGKITKIINKEKPKLFKKYVQKSNHIFIDLILNQQSQQDVDTIVNAIKTKREFEEDINIIVISSLMSWSQTDPYLYYYEKHPQAYKQYIQDYNMPDLYKQIQQVQQLETQESKMNSDQQIEDINQDQNDIEEISNQNLNNQEQINNEYIEDDDTEREIKNYIQIDKLQKKFFKYRNCKQEYQNMKNQEDQLAQLHIVNEKVKVYILYTGLLYGRSQMFLKDYFNKAFLQRSLSIHYDQIIQNYNIPIFSVTNIPQTVMKLIEGDTEDQEQDEQKSIYYGDEQIQQEDNQEQDQEQQNQNEQEQQEEQEEQKPGKLVIEFLTENEIMTHKDIVQVISENLGNGKLIENVKYKYPQNLLTNFELQQDNKFLQITQENKNFKENIQSQIVDYMIEENLNPIKIFYYCLEKDQKSFYNKLSQTYNLRIIDCENFLVKLYQLEGFKQYYKNFTKNDVENFDILMKSDIKILFDNPLKNKEMIIFYIKLLKLRLSLNDCKYKGFVLICKNFLIENIDFQQLFYKNQLSSSYYIRELQKQKKLELKEIRKLERQKQKNKILAEKRYQKLLEEQRIQDELNQQEQNQTQENTQYEDQSNQSQLSKQEELEEDNNQQQDEIQEDIDDVEKEDIEQIEQSQEEQEEQEEDQEEIGVKTREEFFPDHFILLFAKCEEYEYLQQVQNFCIDKKVKFYIKKLSEQDLHVEERQDQIFHLIRIYLNRNLINQPKAVNENSFDQTSYQRIQEYIKKVGASQQVIKITNKFNRQSIAQQHSQQFQDAIKYFHQFQTRETDKEVEESKKYKNNREVLTKIFYEILYEGLLNIKKLDPSDPFEYLSNFVYEKSFE